ncbi:MAG: hypothetical protein JJT93_06455 [Gammaproteobacteria bacterium]|nr:hypothetical protein [Gammaproteobacteria bacterium]TVQ43299.1 MAG: hypothetical protein EA371_15295 [Gammaproteobacteria bacterium]
MSAVGQGRSEGWPGPDQPLDAASVAQLTAVAMRLAMEVSVLRDRLRSHELLLERHGLLSPAAVDALQVPEEEQRLRDGASRALIESLASDIGPR